ncbi:hypothetical protein ACLOJK_018092 [Asimina triloba]
MVSARTRVGLRIAFALFLLLLAFYVGRPLYWKLSATIHDIRENRQTVKQGFLLQSSCSSCHFLMNTLSVYLAISSLPHKLSLSGISQFVLHAQRSVGWYHDESDSGVPDDPKAGAARTRRILRFVHQVRQMA